eukprot:SAG31_NODE_635_length_13360_cov_4.229847_2_plen_136_part_00
MRPRASWWLTLSRILLLARLTIPACSVICRWGFSDLVRLRTPENNRIWRLVGIAVSAVFFLRWMLYVVQHLQHKRLYIYTHSRTTEHIVRKQNVAKFKAVAKLVGRSAAGAMSGRFPVPSAPAPAPANMTGGNAV